MPYEPKGLPFNAFELNQVFESPARTITEADIMAFAGISGDFNPLHTDEVFAASTPHGTRIAHGMLTVSISTGLSNQMGIFEGTTLALLEQTVRYKAAVKPGDTIRLVMTVEGTKASSKGGRGVVTFRTEIMNQRDEIVVDGQWKTLMRD